jgi:hypothetical protein
MMICCGVRVIGHGSMSFEAIDSASSACSIHCRSGLARGFCGLREGACGGEDQREGGGAEHGFHGSPSPFVFGSYSSAASGRTRSSIS